jgi:hypothetical protein
MMRIRSHARHLGIPAKYVYLHAESMRLCMAGGQLLQTPRFVSVVFEHGSAILA